MVKIKIKQDIDADDTVVSPTQVQMDNWVALELSEADETQMLTDELPVTIFDESTNSESID